MTTETADAGSKEPQQIGPYRLLESIGEGGFGTVYRAEQSEPVRRQVALKLIKLGMDTKQVVARFEAERQALALMDHPCIAHVFDAGATDSGRPYFVMELVDGVPITEFCDQRKLSMRARLTLFQDVCRAVQHAHQKGIIHRDIKPSNVLVGAHDGKPAPKVIDFGIAKATEARLTEMTVFTEVRQVIGTPEYMAPEQAEGSGIDIDTRADVYSLGVLLYELLTGTKPFDVRTLIESGYTEIMRHIKEVEPPRPSTRLSALGERLDQVAKLRDSVPRTLGKEVRGDLDWVVMKALEKDRTRRYDSASALADDIDRYLADQPVIAGPPTASYRFRKFAQRNRGLLAGSAAVAVALLTAVAVLAWALASVRTERDAAQLARANEKNERERAEAAFVTAETARTAERTQREQAEAAREEAERLRREEAEARLRAEDARDESEAVTDFLADALASASPTDRGRNVTVRELLDAAAARIDAGFTKQPLVEARLRDAIGDTYFGLGLLAAAETHLRRAVAIYERIRGADHPTTLGTRRDLALLFWRQGRYAEAEPELERLLDARGRNADDEDTLDLWNLLAIVYWDQARIAEAEEIWARLLEVHRRVAGPTSEGTVNALNNLAMAYEGQARHREAEPLYLEAIEIRRRLDGEEHPDTLKGMHNLGTLYYRAGRYEEARLLYEPLLATRRRVLGPEHPDTLTTLGNLAINYLKQGRYAEAEALQIEALETERRVLGPEHQQTLISMMNLALVYSEQGRHADAEPVLLETVEAQRRVLGEENPRTLDSLNNLAIHYMNQGRHGEAEEIYRQVIDIRVRVSGPDHPDTLRPRHNLATLLKDEGRLEEAEAMHLEIIEIHTRVSGPDHGDTLFSKHDLAWTYREMERHEDAERVFREVVEGRVRAHGEASTDTLDSMTGLAKAYFDQGKLDEARAVMERMIAIGKRLATAPDATPTQMNMCAVWLADCELEDLREPGLALELAQTAVERTQRQNPYFVQTLALAHHRTGDLEGAIELQKEAMALIPEGPGRAPYEFFLAEYEAEAAAREAD